MQSQYRDTIKRPRSLRNRCFIWINECFQFFFISQVFLYQKDNVTRVSNFIININIKFFHKSITTYQFITDTYHKSISYTQNLIFKKSQICSPCLIRFHLWNCKYRLKASLLASQSQRKRMKIQSWEKPRDHLRLSGKAKGQWFDGLPLKLPHVSLCNSTRSGHGGTQICVFECA